MEALKKGTTFHLAVAFNGVTLDDVEKIEFIFRLRENRNKTAVKTCTYPGEASRETDGDRILVPWTEDETWKIPDGSTFYMDTRITMKGNADQPATNIVKLTMGTTLFDQEEGT